MKSYLSKNSSNSSSSQLSFLVSGGLASGVGVLRAVVAEEKAVVVEEMLDILLVDGDDERTVRPVLVESIDSRFVSAFARMRLICSRRATQ